MPSTAHRRRLPAIGALLQEGELIELSRVNGRVTVAHAARSVVNRIRRAKIDPTTVHWTRSIAEEVERLARPSLRRVINASGVVLHTNLGRAPLSAEAWAEVGRLITGYTNLEYDLASGERGSRQTHCVEPLCLATGAEDALVVNNNAAAVMLALRTHAKGREVIVSRGELVEIGGSFRVPEILELSGATLREVGTTNRTRLSDYSRAIGSKTAMILKVHPSNYRIEGFVEEVAVVDLVRWAKKHRLPLLYDVGAALLRRNPLLPTAPVAQDLVAQGVDLLTFSGDKLMGGPQAGIALGRSTLLAPMRKEPWMRVIRPDKVTLALLEALVRSEIRSPGSSHTAHIFERSTVELRNAADSFQALLAPVGLPFKMALEEIDALAGGGSLAQERLSSIGLILSGDRKRLDRLERELRRADPPVVVRRRDGRMIFDLRTIFVEELPLLAEAVHTSWTNVSGTPS